VIRYNRNRSIPPSVNSEFAQKLFFIGQGGATTPFFLYPA
jgi:hypothetical protein